MVLRAPIAEGEFLTRELAEETPCREEQPRLPLRYDRAAGAPVASEGLAAGTYLGHLTLAAGEIAAVGDKLRLVVRNGPVIIVREVSPIRAVRSGDPAIVKTGDGKIITARFVAVEAPR